MKPEFDKIYNLYLATKDDCNCGKSEGHTRKINMIKSELATFGISAVDSNAVALAKQLLQKNGY